MPRKYVIGLIAVALVAGLLYAVLTPASGKSEDIDNGRLQQLQREGVPLVDVRTPEEFAGSHITGAVNVPMDQLTSAAGSWDKNAPIIVYCATGARSANAASFLSAQGFKKVYNLKSGIVSWDGPTVAGETDDAAPSPSSAVTVETDGKPVFIDFSGST